MTNKQLAGIIIVALIVLGAISMIVSSASDRVDSLAPSEPQVYEDVVEDAYKNIYVEACMEEATYSYCNCTWNHMENALGRQRMLDMMLEFEENIIPEPMVNAIYHCMMKHL